MINPEQQSLFKNGSTTYFTSSLFFPKKIRDDITRLYAFVRKADDYVDTIPQQKSDFIEFRKRYETALKNKQKGLAHWQSGDLIVDDFILLAETYAFQPAWTTSFLDAMESDLHEQVCKTIEDTKKYMYGSAEVIGLYLCHLLHLPKEAHEAAMMQGRAMQFCNFIRDIAEDNTLRRQYLPLSEAKAYGLSTLSREEAQQKSAQFAQYINAQIARYEGWQKEAAQGYRYIPRKFRVAVKTAAYMYRWTMRVIAKDPLIVFTKKVKPTKVHIVFMALLNFILP